MPHIQNIARYIGQHVQNNIANTTGQISITDMRTHNEQHAETHNGKHAKTQNAIGILKKKKKKRRISRVRQTLA